MMTPQEVANCTFAKAVMGGYNMAAVDDFLDKLTEDYSALHKENAALKAKMKVLVDKMEEYREMEDAMRSTLLTAQKMASSIVAEAEAKRDLLIADSAGAAKVRMDEIDRELADHEARLAAVRQEVNAQIAAEEKRLQTAQQALRGFIQTVQTACQSQLELLNTLPELPVEAAETAAPQPAAEPAKEAVENPTIKLDAALERDLASVFDAVDKQEEEEEENLAALFTMDSYDAEDEDATRILKLDDLQFGRNYNKD